MNAMNTEPPVQTHPLLRAARLLLTALLPLLLLTLLVSCAAEAPEGGYNGGINLAPSQNDAAGAAPESNPNGSSQGGEEGGAFRENPFVSTEEQPTSTFSSDVDTASYAYFRKLIDNGLSFFDVRDRYGSSIRTEELLNYFRYRYTAPAEGDLFGVATEIAPCPWNGESLLLLMNLTAETAEPNPAGNNLVFLIDVSGSMSASDKLPLLKQSFAYLTEQLTERDLVSIVTYSGEERVVLEGCRGNERDRILAALDSLTASGSTNGQAGIQRAYEIAESCRIVGGNNRIIMASDGDLNVGISSTSELTEFIAEKRETGIYLSVLGFGTGNYKDKKMEALADNGNGVYYYVDGAYEAERIFGESLLSTLYTVAEDVKLQVTFDPDFVSSYRLIGYENRLLSEEDFDDDTKDAGEIGSGHTLTVCYELKLTDPLANPPEDGTEKESEKESGGGIVPLSYTRPLTGKEPPRADGEGEVWFHLSVRWKAPETDVSVLDEYTVGSASYTETPSYEFRFAAAVIETAMLLHRSEHLGTVTLDGVIEDLRAMDFTDDDKSAFLALLEKARRNP